MKLEVICLGCNQLMTWRNDGFDGGAWFCFYCPEVIYPHNLATDRHGHLQQGRSATSLG